MKRIVIVVFVLSWLFAMIAYPGWNSFDPDSTGYDPLRNFLCDLLSAKTPDGRNNVASASAMMFAVAMLVVTRLLPLWWNVQVRGRLRVLCRVLGGLASLLTLLVCVEQAFALDLPHGTMTLTAGAVGLLPTAIVVLIDWRSLNTSRLRRVTMVGMLIAGLTNFISYSIVQFGGVLTPVVPTAQGCALLLLLLWLWLLEEPHTTVVHSA